MRLLSVLSASLIMFAAACSDDEDTATLPCDVRSRACQKAVFKATAEARGQKGAVLPPVRVITRKQLADELRAETDDTAAQRDEAEATRGRQSQQALALLKLMPEPAEQSSDDAYVEQAANGIAAYYSSYSKDVTVIADQVSGDSSEGDSPSEGKENFENGTFTLSHEFVHALQDQREDLTKWRKAVVDTSDAMVSSKCLTEGEAVWLSYVTFYRALYAAEPERIDRDTVFSRMLTGFLDDIEMTDAPFLSALETLPYPMGGRQVSNIYLSDGAAEVGRLYKEPRLALRSWADDTAGALPEPLDCQLPAAPDGYKRVLSDRLGFAGVLSFHTGTGWDGATAYAGALPWRNDEIVGYASSDNSEAVAVAWRVRVESADAADELAQTARDANLDARAVGSELLIAAATEPGLLESWLPHEGCVTSDKGRSSAARSRLLTLEEQLGIER